MYKVYYYFDNMLEKVYEFSSRQEALDFYHKHDKYARRSIFNRFEYVGKEGEEDWNIW